MDCARAVTATSMRDSVTQTVSGANLADFILQPAGSGLVLRWQRSFASEQTRTPW